MLPFGLCCSVRLVRDDHRQDQCAAIASGLLCRLDQARDARGDRSRLVLTKACAEVVIRMLRGKARSCIALPCTDNRDLSRGKWTAATVVHGEEAAFVIGMTRRPQLSHDRHVFGEVL